MYEIIMYTWYPETPNDKPKEVFEDKGFETIEDAAKFLGENIEHMTEYYPIMWISIEFNISRSLN